MAPWAAEAPREEWAIPTPAAGGPSLKIWEAGEWEAGLDLPEWEAAARVIPVQGLEAARRLAVRRKILDLEQAAQGRRALAKEEDRRVAASVRISATEAPVLNSRRLSIVDFISQTAYLICEI